MSARQTSSRSGSGESLRIAVGGCEDRDHEVASADRQAAELDVGRRPAVEAALDRPLEAEQLLHRRGEERRVVPHERELLGLLEQVHDRVPDQADRRLVPGHDQQHDRAEQLLLRQRVLRVARRQERADEIVARLGAPCGEEVGQVGDELAHLREELLQLVVLEHGGDDRVRPVLEAIVVGRRHAEHLGDHSDREREGVLGREVHLAPGLDRVEELVGDRLDPRPQLLDHLRRERLRHEPAQAAVILAVPVQHVVLDRRDRGRRRLGGELLLASAPASGRGRSARRPSAPRRRPRAGSGTRSASRRRGPAGAAPDLASRIRAKTPYGSARKSARRGRTSARSSPPPEHRLARCRCSS